MLVRAPVYCFSVKFSCFRFTKSIKPSKGRWTRFGLSFAVVNIIKMILMLHEGRRSPVIIWLCLWFPSICFYEISQNFHNLWNFSSGSFKIRKKVVTDLKFCVFFVYLKFVPTISFYQQVLQGAQICLTVQQILGNSTEGNTINLARNIPIFFVAK